VDPSSSPFSHSSSQSISLTAISKTLPSLFHVFSILILSISLPFPMDSAPNFSPHSQNHTSAPPHCRVNGFLVYTRRKRPLNSANDAVKRLKTEEIKTEDSRREGPLFNLSEVESPNDPNSAQELTKTTELNTPQQKKIVVVKKPVTVKELFETGLLEGVPVVYVGCKKVRSACIAFYPCRYRRLWRARWLKRN